VWSTSPWPGGTRGVPDVTVVEVLGETVRELEDVGVAEEGLVAAEKRETCHRRDWRRDGR